MPDAASITLDPTRPTLGVVVNPRARSLRRDPQVLARLRAAAGTHALVREARDLAELNDIALEFREARIAVLAVAGGDGSNTVTLTGFARAYGEQALPALALLRAGTMNTVADALGVPRLAPDVLLRRLVRAARDGEALSFHERATIDVAGRLGFLFGTGVFRSFLDEYYAAGPDPSPGTAARTLARIAGSIVVRGPLAARLVARESLELDVDGTPWGSGPYLTVAAGTVDQVGLGFRPFCRAFERADAFHLLALGASATQALRMLPRIHRGRPLPAGLAADALVRDATIRPTQPGAAVRAMVDGDLIEVNGPLRLRVGPRVRVIDVPARGV